MVDYLLNELFEDLDQEGCICCLGVYLAPQVLFNQILLPFEVQDHFLPIALFRTLIVTLKYPNAVFQELLECLSDHPPMAKDSFGGLDCPFWGLYVEILIHVLLTQICQIVLAPFFNDHIFKAE